MFYSWELIFEELKILSDREHSQGYSDAQPPQLQTPGSEQESPMYRNAVDYVGSVKKAYLSNPRVYTEFLEALEKYHNSTYE